MTEPYPTAAPERRLARAGFTLTRDFPVPIERVWEAFADERQKKAWFGTDDNFEAREWAFDFRVGGVDVAEASFHKGPVSRYVGTYTDIVELTRIVTTYDMWLNGVHMSTSVASFEFEPADGPDGAGTLFTHVEHGVFFDQLWADGAGREEGTRGIHDKLGTYLAGGG
jgi:uncharacterized protein YndB with AHSA1/START domain